MLTSVQLREEDWQFCKEQGLKFSDLLRSAISREKELKSGMIVDNVEEERRKRIKFQDIAFEIRKELEVLKEEYEKLKNE